VRTVAELEEVELARAASTNPEAQNLVPAACEVSGDWRNVATAADLDGVIIATPPARHAEMTRVAIDAGLAVLVEKPLALSASDARCLLALARERNAWVLVDHTHLFHPAFERLAKLAAECGRVRRIRAEAGNRGPFREDVPVLWDWGAHDVAMCLSLVPGEPRSVSSRFLERRTSAEGQGETLELTLELANGAPAELRLSNLFGEKRRWFEVTCDQAVLRYDPLSPSPLVVIRSGEPIESSAPTGALPLTRAVLAFVAGIRSEARDFASLSLGVDVVSTLERAAVRAEA
jgi:predicted dehydrogenase